MPRPTSDATEGEAHVPDSDSPKFGASTGDGTEVRPTLSAPDDGLTPSGAETASSGEVPSVEATDAVTVPSDETAAAVSHDLSAAAPYAEEPTPDHQGGDETADAASHAAIPVAPFTGETTPEAVRAEERAEDEAETVTEAATTATEEAEPVRRSWEEPARAEPVAPVEEDIHPHEEEAGGTSVAAWLLGAILFLIAGGALALWGGPRLAPHLPSGMSGFASWLSPGGDAAEAKIAALEAKLEARVGALETQLAGGDVDTRVRAAVQASESKITSEIKQLRDSVASTDSAALTERIASLQSAIDGQSAEVDALKDQIAGAAPGTVDSGASEKIDVYRAELDGVRTEVGALQGQVAGFSARLDEVLSKADREVTAAQEKVEEVETKATADLSAAEAQASLALVRAAVASGAPYADALKPLEESGKVSIPEGLAAGAASGVASMANLRESFPEAAHAAIRESIVASAQDDVLSRTKAFFEAQVATRSLTPQSGNSPDAVLSRVEDKLRQDDLNGALQEAAALPTDAQAEMSGWLQAAKLRAGAVEGLKTLETELSAN